MPYAPLLTEAERGEAMAALPDWSHEGDVIVRTVRTPSFREAIALVDAVADAAESADHHPDITIVWRRVTFRLTSKASGGLTRRDTDLAAEIDRLAAAAGRGNRDAFPILQARDPGRLVDFYRDAFGFEQRYRFPKEGDLQYAFMRLRPLGIGIGRRPPDAPEPTEARDFELWVYVDDADAAAERAASSGATVLEPATDQPWGERVALVADPEGFRIRIGAESAEGRG